MLGGQAKQNFLLPCTLYGVLVVFAFSKFFSVFFCCAGHDGDTIILGC